MVLCTLWAATAAAQDESVITPIPEIRQQPPVDAEWLGKPVVRIEVISLGQRWKSTSSVQRVRLGEPYSGEVARRAMRELLDTGLYADANAEVQLESQGVRLTIRVEPRRIVREILLLGSPLPEDTVLEAAHLGSDVELAENEIPKVTERLRAILSAHGFPSAKIQLDVAETDNPLETNLIVRIERGTPALITKRRFRVSPAPDAPGLSAVLFGYGLQTGDRADEEQLARADHDLERDLRHQGWHRATVSHQLVRTVEATGLDIIVKAGAFVKLEFEGLQSFDADQLLAALDLDNNEDMSPRGLSDRLRTHYVKHGLLDAQITYRIDGTGTPNERLVFIIREQERVRVVGREYPCLTGSRPAADIGAEIDSFLSEDLPGAEILGPVDPARVDSALGPKSTTGARPQPADVNPWTTYELNVYERATKHLQDLYRSEGYLSATVGPTQVLRRRCNPHSMPGTCEPIGDRQRPKTLCAYDDIGLPMEEPPPDPKLGCVANPARSIECEPTAILHLPIKLGPRAFLWDVEFEGNTRITDTELLETAAIVLGSPVSFAEIDQARRRVLDAYSEKGFAFADVTTTIDLSPNRRRAKLRISIREGEQVRVSAIYIRGAKITRETLIRSRLALKVGEPYRLSDVRATEERLATLGVFSSVRVGFEDPYVPAREKVIIVDVVERVPMYVEPLVGVSSGEGFRTAFEFGHLNIAHRAIQLTIRTQFGYLPNAFILESDVRHNYETDPRLNTFTGRLTRRDSLAVTFPDIGLGPLFRFRVEGIDVLSNARDFQLTKDANINTLFFSPSRKLTLELGGSLERNDVHLFNPSEGLVNYIQSNPQYSNSFRVPEGTSVAVTQKFGVNWDLRNFPLDATRGTLANLTVEHVTAFPLGSNTTTFPASWRLAGAFDPSNPFQATHSEFLRSTSRVAGYIPIGSKGAALALSFRWGLNLQLRKDSSTYPDRLFFGGGVDTLRGFLQDSLVPEDIAQQIIRSGGTFNISQVVIRGGNFLVNPRAEVRIPVTRTFQTALFLDAGNVWTRAPSWLTLVTGNTPVPSAINTPNTVGAGATPSPPTWGPKSTLPPATTSINYFHLRYSVGTGLRIATPIGPLVFDYGFNIERVLDRLIYTSQADQAKQRYWEDLGAFHFSIGLF
jgi:outer membrane protein assembly factor BamA